MLLEKPGRCIEFKKKSLQKNDIAKIEIENKVDRHIMYFQYVYSYIFSKVYRFLMLHINAYKTEPWSNTYIDIQYLRVF